jgi:hypothetical protein
LGETAVKIDGSVAPPLWDLCFAAAVLAEARKLELEVKEAKQNVGFTVLIAWIALIPLGTP